VVIESATIQSIGLDLRQRAIAAIAATLAPDGLLFVLASLHPDGAPLASARPWPVSRGELTDFTAAGLQELSYTPGRVRSPAAPRSSRSTR
jgi:hypothetical protein